MRWIARILIIFIVLLLLAAAGMQAVLWSDWPRRELIARLQQETGLIVEARSMRAGWFGHSVLHDLEVRLPLADQPFVRMPQLHVEHTSLPMLLMRGINIEFIRASQPRIELVEDAAGQWNVQQAIELIIARRANRPGVGSNVVMPHVVIRDATLTITNRGGHSLALPTSDLTGKPENPLEWTFQAAAPPLLNAKGRIAPLATLPHQVRLELQDAGKLVQIFSRQSFEGQVRADVTWDGAVHDGVLDGRAQIHHAQFNDHILNGTVDISFFDETLTVSHPNLTFSSAALGGNPVVLNEGRATLRAGTLDIQQGQLHAMGVTTSLQGQFDLASRSASVQSQWSGHIDPLQLDVRGSMTAKAQWPEIGSQQCSATVQSHATWADRQLTSEFNASASGPSWTEMDGAVVWSKLMWRGPEHQADLSGLHAIASIDWPSIRVEDLTLPKAQAKGIAAYNAQSGTWSVSLALKQWTLPVSDVTLQAEPVSLTVKATGAAEGIQVAALDIELGDYQLNSSGQYVPGDLQPLVANAKFKAMLKPDKSENSSATQAVQFDGELLAQAQVRGSVQPLQLQFEAHVTGTNLPARNGTLESLSMPVHGTINSAGAEFQSQNASVLGGTLNLLGTFHREQMVVDLNVTAHDASLHKLAVVAKTPVDLQGTADGSAHIRIAIDDPLRPIIDGGQWSARDLRSPAGPIASAQGSLRASDGVFQLSDFTIASDATADSGTVTGSATFNSTDKSLAVDAHVANWPVVEQRAATSLRVSGPATLQVDLISGRISGSAEFLSEISFQGHRAGEVRAELAAENRTVRITKLEGNVWNGTIAGKGSVPIDQWTASSGELNWRQIDVAPIAAILPDPEMFHGLSSGSAVIQPAQGPRALGPLQIQLTMKMEDGRSRSVDVGDISLTAYAGADSLVIDDGRFKVADGEVRVWGRLSPHGSDPFAHITASFDRLDLNQLVHWVEPKEGPVPGRLSGSASAGGYLRPVGESHRLFGQSDLTLVESDLVNIGIFTLIHDALSLSIGEVQPNGEGRATVRMEGNSLELSRLEYYNRGTDVVASVRIADVRLRGNSPINGVAVGAMRPLKKFSVPFFQDFDRAIKALQTGAASVRISGTIEKPVQKLVPFAEIAGAFERILTGSVN